MNPLIFWIIGFTALGGVLSVLTAASFLLLPEAMRTRLLPPLVSFAIGALLGAAFLEILPHAFESPGVKGAHSITLVVLLGILVFFLLEKMVIWRHCHTHDCDVHGGTNVAIDRTSKATDVHGGTSVAGAPSGEAQNAHRMSKATDVHGGTVHVHAHDMDRLRQMATGKLILIGDGIHNMVDGVLIAAAFLADFHLGVVTSIAVIAHEIPQELGDFAILLHSGYSRSKALLYNVLTSLTTVIGGVAAYYFLSSVQQIVPYVLAIAASSFIYIAVADLIPGLHKRPEFSATVQQVTLIVLGVALIYATHSTLH
jgi:zinc and cadmium transporter